MYAHILISTDGSELAQKGVDHGLSLADENGSKVTIITVTEAVPVPSISRKRMGYGGYGPGSA